MSLIVFALISLIFKYYRDLFVPTTFHACDYEIACQPEFLALVAIGCLMISSTILPLSPGQGKYRFEHDSITMEETSASVPNKDISRIVSLSLIYIPK